MGSHDEGKIQRQETQVLSTASPQSDLRLVPHRTGNRGGGGGGGGVRRMRMVRMMMMMNVMTIMIGDICDGEIIMMIGIYINCGVSYENDDDDDISEDDDDSDCDDDDK